MWIILLSLFVLAEVVTGEIDCNNHIFQECKHPKLFLEIPREVETFKAHCPELSPFIQCSRDYDMKCLDEDYRLFQQPEKYADFIAVLDEICDERSALNKVATTKLKCFNETFSNTNCVQENDAFVKLHMEPDKPLDEFTPSHVLVIPERIHCLSDILLAGCLVKDITRNCGISARIATLEYIHRSSFLDSSCSLSYRKSLLEDIDEFNLTGEQKTFTIAELERLRILDDIRVIRS